MNLQNQSSFDEWRLQGAVSVLLIVKDGPLKSIFFTAILTLLSNL
ncbi:MAG: hypothetical protein ABI707_04975 [Ferruginibacter sp.]